MWHAMVDSIYKLLLSSISFIVCYPMDSDWKLDHRSFIPANLMKLILFKSPRKVYFSALPCLMRWEHVTIEVDMTCITWFHLRALLLFGISLIVCHPMDSDRKIRSSFFFHARYQLFFDIHVYGLSIQFKMREMLVINHFKMRERLLIALLILFIPM